MGAVYATRGPRAAAATPGAAAARGIPSAPPSASVLRHCKIPEARISSEEATMASPDEMMAAVTRSMRERTGRTLEEWVELVRSSGIDPLDQNAVRRWLKTEHGVPQNSQWAIADAAARAAGWQQPTVEEYIAQQYAGKKAALRPIFDRLRAVLESLGKDVTVEGRGTYTPFVRRRQFAA